MTDTKVAVVLGVGPGLGAAAASRFAREGYAVALMARREESLRDAASRVAAEGGRSASILVDAGSPASVASAFAEARATLGATDVFVYNAGAFQMGAVVDLSPEVFEACWKANCFGAFLGAREVLPEMLARGRGTILFTGATAALRGSANFSALAVGKFGLRALAQSLARENGPRGIHVVHAVIDGGISTPRARAMMPGRDPDGMLDPEAIAETYWQLHLQPPRVWTHELDLRPAVEKF